MCTYLTCTSVSSTLCHRQAGCCGGLTLAESEHITSIRAALCGDSLLQRLTTIQCCQGCTVGPSAHDCLLLPSPLPPWLRPSVCPLGPPLVVLWVAVRLSQAGQHCCPLPLAPAERCRALCSSVRRDATQCVLACNMHKDQNVGSCCCICHRPSCTECNRAASTEARPALLCDAQQQSLAFLHALLGAVYSRSTAEHSVAEHRGLSKTCSLA